MFRFIVKDRRLYKITLFRDCGSCLCLRWVLAFRTSRRSWTSMCAPGTDSAAKTEQLVEVHWCRVHWYQVHRYSWWSG